MLIEVDEHCLMVYKIDSKGADVVLRLDILTATLLVGLFQMSLRHVKLPYSVALHGFELVRALQSILAKIDPENAETLAKGWDPTFDVPINDDDDNDD